MIATSASALAAFLIFFAGVPLTVIAISGAGVPTFVAVTPSTGFVVMWWLSRPSFRPTFLATLRVVAELVTRFETSPSVVGELETGAALSGASGWPR